MGMFDYISCDYPLPNDPPEFVKEPGHEFQTKSLECSMDRYHIDSEGKLFRIKSGWGDTKKEPEFLFDYCGLVNFYDGNTGCYAGGVPFTSHGEDSIWVEYNAQFDHGLLKKIEEIARESEPALDRKYFEEVCKLSQRGEFPTTPLPENLEGLTFYNTDAYLGGLIPQMENPQPVPLKFISGTSKEWVLQNAEGRFEIAYPHQYGSQYFLSEEEARRFPGWLKEEQERANQRVEAFLKEKGYRGKA